MKSENYKFLTEKFKVNDEKEMLIILNHRIEDILSQSCSTMDTIQALICKMEAENNRSSYYAIMSIAYSFIVLLATFAINVYAENKGVLLANYCVAIVIILAIIILLILAVIENKNSERRTFILYVLKSKYEEIKKNGGESLKNINRQIKSGTCEENEKIYIVKVKKRK